jgi:hypothetical protein
VSSATDELEIPFCLVRVDLTVVDELADVILRALKNHYETRPHGRAAELEAVTALADVVAATLGTTDGTAPELRGAFMRVLERGIAAAAAWAPSVDAGVAIEVPHFLPSREKNRRLS